LSIAQKLKLSIVCYKVATKSWSTFELLIIFEQQIFAISVEFQLLKIAVSEQAETGI